MIEISAMAHSSEVRTRSVNPEALYDPRPNGYSHAVIAQGGKHIAYIAGQGGEDRNGRLSDSFGEQVRQAYANLRIVLDAVGAKPHQVTRVTTYVVDYHPSLLGVLTHYAQATFGAALPAQTLVPVPRLALDGMLFEVDAIVVLD
ncbi:MAG: RidA family protein [Pseudomonadota bacterium]